ncbi:Scr1 family TA system antitoxin-like transcriptional regulator, partial [Streptomyces sp. NPDC000405]|uniref:Scr1 family TA system antitoxin-like transcriptional regulator n=1 Tax=Streptomyces sp. NPDC000405 TaxID=3161033 RepID=UPI00398C8609
MTRPRDWEPLHDGDPIPGDPYEVARLGKELRGMADEIEKQAGNIRALASVEGWDSDAGRAFHEIADGTSGRLKRAFDRYDEAARALGTKVVDGGESKEYASELHRAQKVADKALSDFRAAEGDHRTALSGLEQYRAARPGVSIQVVPFRTGAHVGLQGPFVLLEFD